VDRRTDATGRDSKKSDIEITNDGSSDLEKQIDQLLCDNNSKKKTIMQTTILSVTGKPGLYKLLTRSKSNLIVEALDETHRRMPVFANDKVISLGDIAMYTDGDDVPLKDVLTSMGKIEESKVTKISHNKASSKELKEYFAKVLPNFDRDRVRDSDIRKLIQWYNILVKAGITNFDEALSPTQGDNVEDRMEEAEPDSSN